METNEQENTNPTTEQDAAEATAAKAAATAPEQDASPENDAAASGESSDETADPAENAAGAEAANGESAAAETSAAPTEPDWKEMYARTMADFDNFRKRTARDREELFKSAARCFLKGL